MSKESLNSYSRSTSFIVSFGFLMSIVLSGCHSSDTNPLTNSPDIFLVPGNSAQYTGTQSVEVTFVAPAAKTPDSSAEYTTTESDTVLASPSGAAAPIDLHRVTAYTTATAPQYGNDPATTATDQYETLTPMSDSIAIVLAQTVSVQTGTNVTDADNLASGAPYAYTSTTTTTYATPTTTEILPLTTGTQWNTSLARTVNAVSNTKNASDADYAASNLTTVYQPDDSYSETGQNGLTSSTIRSVASNGSATITNTNTSTNKVSLQETIGVPTKVGADYVIPVSTTTNASPVNDSAADWYPGAALPPSPLGSVTYTVIGPAATLPDDCTYTGTQPNVVEYDSTTSVVDVIAGTVTTGTSRTFDSNGLAVCRLSVSTVKSYTLTTGRLNHTTVTTTASSLNNT
jgi:hypothetical protein